MDVAPVVTVFRSRLREDAADYPEEAARIAALARTMPGLLELKSYTAPDGERLTYVLFESMETHDAWRRQADHVAAQQRGRRDFYAWYRSQVCTVLRDHEFEGSGVTAEREAPPRGDAEHGVTPPTPGAGR